MQEKARKAMNFLWKQRHRSSDLVGTVINIHTGDWVRRGNRCISFNTHLASIHWIVILSSVSMHACPLLPGYINMHHMIAMDRETSQPGYNNIFCVVKLKMLIVVLLLCNMMQYDPALKASGSHRDINENCTGSNGIRTNINYFMSISSV